MNRKSKIFINIGLLLLMAALCLTVYNLWDEARASKVVDNTLVALMSQIPREASLTDSLTEQTSLGKDERIIPDYILDPHRDMPYILVDDHAYIGVLEIPSQDLLLPILSDWDYSKLKISPCRYTGSAYLDNFVILAHNYASHFGHIKDINIGESIFFTDIDGNIFSYQVVELESLQSTDVEEIKSGDWDLTLFTCTIGGQQRIAVRCERESE